MIDVPSWRSWLEVSEFSTGPGRKEILTLLVEIETLQNALAALEDENSRMRQVLPREQLVNFRKKKP